MIYTFLRRLKRGLACFVENLAVSGARQVFDKAGLAAFSNGRLTFSPDAATPNLRAAKQIRKRGWIPASLLPWGRPTACDPKGRSPAYPTGERLCIVLDAVPRIRRKTNTAGNAGKSCRLGAFLSPRSSLTCFLLFRHRRKTLACTNHNLARLPSAAKTAELKTRTKAPMLC